jgi:hypothetical protein
MTIEQLKDRLVALPLDGTELMTQAQFHAAFGAMGSIEEQKQHAIHVAEEKTCQVRFIGLEECYAAFIKVQGDVI